MATANGNLLLNREEIDFQLFEMLDIESLCSRDAFKDHDVDMFRSMLDVAERLAVDGFLPGYRNSDLVEPHLVDGIVVTEPGIAEALERFTELGFMSASVPFEEGGMQLPWTVAQACYSMFQAANIGASVYYFLTISAANVLRKFGTEEQKALFMRPMLEGRFFGTMCLSEPQAGSSLADIRTKAVRESNGSYRILGNKMWISCGQQDISENIIHLVLAKIEGGPSGTRGISLFAVPRRIVNPDGSLGADNNVELIGLNHKMGYRAAVNTALSFGDKGPTIGYLVGEPHQGLEAMFVMMNEARISVGCGATMSGNAGYQYSLNYAKERLQGRHPDDRDPSLPPVPLIEHADIRRMLLTQKSFVEGALALCNYAAFLVDQENTDDDPERRNRARQLLAILTPIVKSWPSEFCLEANKLAIQVLGGSGYVIDHPVEQYYRDNRLNLIHEGTNGIQAIDLLGRKVEAEGGDLWSTLVATIRDDIAAAGTVASLVALSEQLGSTVDRVEAVTKRLVGLSASRRQKQADATVYLDMLGHVCIGWMWLRQAVVAERALRAEASTGKADFYRGKLVAAEFFYAYELGRVDHWLDVVGRNSSLTVELDIACL